ncbi:complement factor H-like isoform X3 [Electrophorus electricus]|uniref:complement factor H-like isoform X3 n=1 Tax=Electrophorus electricus TaxID=8005 RepID=UPI0015D08434|nr:complement factor H-like isoform X3 [Electrophorus electricus]
MYECTSPRKMLDGAESIHCTKDGTWSVSVPNCIDIKCLPPQILFGTIIEPQEEYQENELIKYACDKGYKATPGTPKCTKNGWSIKPECEEVTCVLQFGIPGVHSTSPSGKNIFKPEESLTLTCRKDHWILGTRLNSQIIKCKDNGEWERSPICNDITCNVPHDENLAHPFYYFSGDKKLGDTKFYECNYNYRKTASYATCTIDGWSPRTLCTKMTCPECIHGYQKTASRATCTIDGWSPRTLCTKMTCPEPEIAHAEILRPKDTYTIGDRITIQCFPGYEPVSSFVITCKRQQKWENMKRCTLAKGACGKLTLTNGFIQYSKDHDGAQRASYSCDTGYKAFDEKWWGVVTCQQGVWSHQPQCIRKNECGSLPNVKHGKQIQINEAHQDGQRLKIECDLGYKSRLSSIRCLNGQWETSVCERHRCNTPPEVENAVITSYSTDQELEQLVTFKCKEGLELHGHDTISCINSKWEQTPTCKPFQCPNPDHKIENGVLMTSDHDNKGYWEGDKVEYKCNDGFRFPGENIANCTQREWSYPKCETSPTISLDQDTEIPLNETNQHGDKLLGQENSTVACNGQSQTDSGCEEVTCVLEFGIPGLHSTSPSGKNIFKPGESLTLTCRKDHWILGTRLSSQIIKCKDNGEWERSPICNEITCNVPHDENVAHPFYYFSGDKKLGDTKFYECNYNYRKTASYATCTIDGWSPRTLCTKMTCPEPEIAHAEILRPKDTYTIGDRIRIQCLPGYEPVSSFVITCKRQQKWENMKRCTRLRCDTPPKVENAIITSHSTELEMEQSVTFKCGEGFELHGHDTILCINSKWEQAPTCKHTVVEAAAPAGT